MERCLPNKLPHEYLFDKIEFWAQLHGLPVNYLNRNFIQQLLVYVGSHRTITSKEERNWGKFARVRIPVDIKKPLRDSISFPISVNKEIMAEIRYERLPRFCSFCGILGHLMKICPKVHQYKDKIHSQFSPEVHQKAFNLIVPKYWRINANAKIYSIDMDESDYSTYEHEDVMDSANIGERNST